VTRRFDPGLMKAAAAGAGMNMVQLQARSGIACKTLGNWQRGLHVPRINDLLKLCDALGVSLDTLLTDQPLDRGEQP
jgi:transcriptional regulator with XRE-family HTH domain